MPSVFQASLQTCLDDSTHIQVHDIRTAAVLNLCHPLNRKINIIFRGACVMALYK